MASVIATRGASKLLSNETFDIAMLGLVGFGIYEFWDEIKLLFDFGKGVSSDVNKAVGETKKEVDKVFTGIGKLAGISGSEAESLTIKSGLEASLGPVGIVAGIFDDLSNAPETDLQKRNDAWEAKTGIKIISNDDASRDCWSNVIEKNMSFRDALKRHIKDMNEVYTEFKYTHNIVNLQTITTLSYSDGTEIWSAYHGVAYICRRHQSDVYNQPTDPPNYTRQHYISDALIAEAIPNSNYFDNYIEESQLVTFNGVSMTYISPRWHFTPNI